VTLFGRRAVAARALRPRPNGAPGGRYAIRRPNRSENLD